MMDNLQTIILTDKDRKSSEKQLLVLWCGEFGHLLMFVLPKINAIRKENPNLHITFASFEDDYIYFRDNNANWTIDEYWAFPRWPANRGCHECQGGDPHEYMFQTRQRVDQLLKQYGHKKVVLLDTPRFSLNQYANTFKQNPRIFYAMKNFVKNEEPIDKDEYIVVYARDKKMPEGFARNWVPERWHEFMNVLSKDYKVYVCGVKDEAIQFDWNDRVINMTHLEGIERSKKSLNILANAKFVVSDCSGSANFALHTGVPCFISGPSPYQKGFEINGNYFNVHVKYQVADMNLLTTESRTEAYRDFLKTFSDTIDGDELIVTGKYGK
jgi:hypothetical protein